MCIGTCAIHTHTACKHTHRCTHTGTHTHTHTNAHKHINTKTNASIHTHMRECINTHTHTKAHTVNYPILNHHILHHLSKYHLRSVGVLLEQRGLSQCFLSLQSALQWFVSSLVSPMCMLHAGARMPLCVCIYVSMCVCAHACVCGVWESAAWTPVCVCVWERESVGVCKHVCMHACVPACVCVKELSLSLTCPQTRLTPWWLPPDVWTPFLPAPTWWSPLRSQSYWTSSPDACGIPLSPQGRSCLRQKIAWKQGFSFFVCFCSFWVVFFFLGGGGGAGGYWFVPSIIIHSWTMTHILAGYLHALCLYWLTLTNASKCHLTVTNILCIYSCMYTIFCFYLY